MNRINLTISYIDQKCSWRGCKVQLELKRWQQIAEAVGRVVYLHARCWALTATFSIGF